MTKTSRPDGAPGGGLSRDRIVDVAIGLLDAEGENGLTFRALAQRLSTGHGAIQWHVSSKGELMMAASTAVLGRAPTTPAHGMPPRESVRAVALDVFDAIDAHPWLGPQLVAAPWQPAMARLWERVGHPLDELGMTDEALFTAVSTLVGYILGVGSQNAANRRVAANESRHDFLGSVADRWHALEPDERSLTGRLAERLRDHDDRAEFLAGVDVILSGLSVPR